MQDGDPDYEENFTVIYKANMPAVLIENLFHSNKKDLALLQNEDFVKNLGQSIAHGIISYIENCQD